MSVSSNYSRANSWTVECVTMDFVGILCSEESSVRIKSDVALVLCLCAGADSDWHHLESVTCREGHAQRVERG